MASVQELKKDFKRLVDQEALIHGYIFFGPADPRGQSSDQDPKTLFAKQLASYLETKKWQEPVGILLDALEVDIKVNSGIDAVRAVQRFLFEKPIRSPRRTLILKNAEWFTTAAEHAILKVAEEPPPSALILLVANDQNILFPTLRSRFQEIFFSQNFSVREIRRKFSVPENVRDFLKKDKKERVEILKNLLDDEAMLDRFMSDILLALSCDTIRTWRELKEVLHRFTAIRRYSTNRKLQLEAALLPLPQY